MAMPRKFFLISQVFYPDEVSTSGLFTDLCVELVKREYEVEVWCAHPAYDVRERQKNKKITYKGVKISYLPSTNFSKNSLAGRAVNMISFSSSVILKLLFSSDKTAVYTHTTPPFLGILISFLCSLKIRKFVYILLDIFPEGLIRLRKVSKKNIFIRLWHSAFLASLRRSSRIIVLGRDMKEWLGGVLPEVSDRIEYIPLWKNDMIEFNHDFSTNEYILKHNLSGEFIVQYSGNMGLWNNMSTIGRAVDLLVDEVTFMFVGRGVRREELIKAIDAENIPKVLFLPFQPSKKLGSLLAAAHVAIVSLAAGLDAMAVPCKIYGILAAGIPVIAMVPGNSEIAQIIREEKCGYVIDPDDSVSLIKAILFLKTDEKVREAMGVNSRNAFLSKYTLGIITGRYESLINNVEDCSDVLAGRKI